MTVSVLPYPKEATLIAMPFQDGMAAYQRGDYATATQLWRPLADQGNAAAQFNLGFMYKKGQGFPQDFAAALMWYRKAADQGYASAQCNLGLMYERGNGVPQDGREAAHLYKLAADQGNAFGQVKLGFFYEGGRGGLPKDDREAVRLYKLAADQGNASAQTNLGNFYEQGRGGLPKDDCEAARLYKLAADQGNAFGQVKLGFFYEGGRGGLPKDDREAVRLYKLAADQGDARGPRNLANFYEQGRGGLPTDEREAARLYKLAADQGDAWAQTKLGVMYEQGRGNLPKDEREAARLFKLAADQGDAWAQAALTRLGQKQQQEDQQRQGKMLNPLEWKPEHRAGLSVATGAGAALGVAVGFATSGLQRSGFTYWLAHDSDDAFMWACIGALVVGAAIYCYRMFPAEAVARNELGGGTGADALVVSGRVNASKGQHDRVPTELSKAIKLNPLGWKPEHRAGLAIAGAAGAAIGIAMGFATSGLKRWGLSGWFDQYSTDAFMWAFIGALGLGQQSIAIEFFLQR
jgi:TPR repeat protein